MNFPTYEAAPDKSGFIALFMVTTDLFLLITDPLITALLNLLMRQHLPYCQPGGVVRRDHACQYR